MVDRRRIEIQAYRAPLWDEEGDALGAGPCHGEEEVLSAGFENEPQSVVAEPVCGLRFMAAHLPDPGQAQTSRTVDRDIGVVPQVCDELGALDVPVALP